MLDQELRDKVAHELSLFTLKLEGGGRPLLLDNLLAAGLKTLRPNLSADSYKAARLQIMQKILELIDALRPVEERRVGELRALKARVKHLEDRFSSDPRFTEAEVAYMRALVSYGMRKAQVAEMFGVTPKVLARILRRQEVLAIRPARKSGTSSPRGARKLIIDT
jgi:hypothetical protein